jgi:hypothetical protein
MTMHPDIADAVQVVKASKSALREVLARVRKTCTHDRVIHSPWRSSDWGSAFKARLLCLVCGLEEQAKNSGWGDNDSDFEHLKTNGFHKIVTSNDLYSARFPETEVDVP